MGECGMSTGADPSFPEVLGANDSISGLVLSNNLLYSLHSFVWELVHLGKSSSSKIACVEQKMIFSCIWHIKWYSLFSYLMNTYLLNFVLDGLILAQPIHIHPILSSSKLSSELRLPCNHHG